MSLVCSNGWCLEAWTFEEGRIPIGRDAEVEKYFERASCLHHNRTADNGH